MRTDYDSILAKHERPEPSIDFDWERVHPGGLFKETAGEGATSVSRRGTDGRKMGMVSGVGRRRISCRVLEGTVR